MGKHWIQERGDFYGAVPIPSKCPVTGTRTCQRKNCQHYRYSDLARDLDERCAHSAAVAAAVDRQQRELDFHAATQVRDWHRAEQLALAAREDNKLTAAERDVWCERLDAASREITGG